MKIAVTGANGQLGTELRKRLGADCLSLTRPEFDLTDRKLMEDILLEQRPDAIINAAAYTAVDRAEMEESICMETNANAVLHLAEICSELNCPLVQISTDYLFDLETGRETPLFETEETNPVGAYARSKKLGEENAASWEKHFNLRTCGLFSAETEGPIRGRNFADTMISLRDMDQLKIVCDQYCTPTYVPYLADAILFLLTTERFGTYHITSDGQTTWYDFAVELFQQANLEMDFVPISTAEFGAPAPRPSYSVLDSTKYLQLGGPELPCWKTGIADYLTQFKEFGISLGQSDRVAED